MLGRDRERVLVVITQHGMVGFRLLGATPNSHSGGSDSKHIVSSHLLTLTNKRKHKVRPSIGCYSGYRTTFPLNCLSKPVTLRAPRGIQMQFWWYSLFLWSTSCYWPPAMFNNLTSKMLPLCGTIASTCV